MFPTPSRDYRYFFCVCHSCDQPFASTAGGGGGGEAAARVRMLPVLIKES